MTPPALVTAPALPAVTTADMKAHLRVDGTDEDALIAGYVTAATAYLDGCRGVLGRAIMPQTWRVEVIGPGPHLLPMPDVTEAVAEAGGAPVGATLTVTAMGVQVALADVSDETPVQVDFTCAMPAAQLAVVGVAIRLLVGHWYAHREAVAGAVQNVPLGFDMLVAPLRWRPVG